MTIQRYQTLFLGNIILFAKRTFADVMKLRILWGGDYPGVWAINAIENVLLSGGWGDLTGTEERTMWAQRQTGVEWCDHQPRNASICQKLDEARNKVSCEPQQGALPMGHHDFGPGILISDFRPPDLWENTFLLFQATKLVVQQFVTTATGN